MSIFVLALSNSHQDAANESRTKQLVPPFVGCSLYLRQNDSHITPIFQQGNAPPIATRTLESMLLAADTFLMILDRTMWSTREPSAAPQCRDSDVDPTPSATHPISRWDGGGFSQSKDTSQSSTSATQKAVLLLDSSPRHSTIFIVLNMAAFQDVVNVVAYTLSVLTFMSPIPSLFKAWKRRDLGEISLIPFAAMIANTFLWVSYAWLTDDFFPLLSTYACCEVLSIGYVIVYVTLTPYKKRSLKIVAVAVGAVVLVAAYIALARSGVTGQSKDSTATVVGIIANIASFVMFSSPFETIVKVVRTKDASSMPILLCFVGAVGNSVWVIYASLVLDVIILVPNVICSAIGWVQVIVYMIYHPKRAAANREKQLNSPVPSVSVVVESPSVTFAPIASPGTRV